MTLRERLEEVANIEAAQNAAQRFIDDFFDNEGRERPRVSIPAREDDDDIVLTQAVKLLGVFKNALLLAIEQRDRAWFRVGDARHDQEWALKGIAADQDELLAIIEGKVTT